MSVEFEENNFRRADFGSSEPKGLSAWLIKKGIAKDESTANKIQIGASIVFFALAIYFAVR